MAAGKPWLLWLTLMTAALLPAQAQEVYYIHTDALGSVVAETDANGNVVKRSEYEPYGRVLNRPVTNGPGYTGHVEDAATGLTYMQQRYYDPQIGRFLSVDPVIALDNGDMRHFNRYAYAFNNPYRFTDPEGRSPLSKAIKLVLNGGNVAQTFAGVVSDAKTVMNPNASFSERAMAAVSIASEAAPVSVGDAKDVGRAIKAVAGKLGGPGPRTASKIEDATKPGSVPNMRTDVSKAEFEANLTENGFSMSTSKDGKVNVFEKGDTKFTTRDSAKSTGGPTAESFKDGELQSKIRLDEIL